MKALSAWRRSLEHNRTFSAEDLDELEQHLRDQIAGLTAQDLSEEAAYAQALLEMGDHATAEAEYRKVFWGKRRREGGVRHEIQRRLSMVANYVKIAYRNLLRQKGYSFLNVAGLSVGLACAFLIAIWIRDEVSYDRFHESGDRLYRVMRHVHSGDEIRTSGQLAWNIARVLEEEYPEVEDVAIVTERMNLVMQLGEDSVREWGLYAGPAFFEMFSWGLIQGEPDEVLQDPSKIVISASLAQKYFGSEWRRSAVGGTIRDPVYGFGGFTVAGIFEDVPSHSSLQFDFVLPIERFERRNEWLSNWMNSGILIFARTRDGTNGTQQASTCRPYSAK